jgi:hypothetical protein
MHSRAPWIGKPESILSQRLDETAAPRVDTVLRPAGIRVIHQPCEELCMQSGKLSPRIAEFAMYHS